MTMATERGKVLVMDDEAVIREGCQRILTKNGWEVLTAPDGNAGLSLAEDPSEIEVVLLDLKMPGISGMEVLERLLERDPSLPVVVITGYATVDSAVEAMKKGAYDFIAKPFTPDQLRLVVERAAERRRLEREAERLRREAARTLKDVATEKGRVLTIINSMADGVLVTDHEGRIALTNPAATRLLGLSSGEVLGRAVEEVISQGELVKAIREVLEALDTAISQEIQEGDTLIRSHTAPVKDEEGQVMGTVTVLQDLSYILEIDRMKGEFIAMVSHELRSPLSAIDQMLGAIVARGQIAEKDRKFVERARERAKGLLDLINDLLEISRIEAGMALQRKEPLQLEEVVRKVVEFHRAEAEGKGLDLRFEAREGLPSVLGDPRGLEGVFTNLVSNAIKYTPSGGRIEVRVEPEGDYVKVTVADTGVGIPEEDLPRIFDKFYRVKSAETRGIVGTGLGLSIVKSVVEAHFGSVSVQSQEGKGTTFTVLLPRHREGATA